MLVLWDMSVVLPYLHVGPFKGGWVGVHAAVTAAAGSQTHRDWGLYYGGRHTPIFSDVVFVFVW